MLPTMSKIIAKTSLNASKIKECIPGFRKAKTGERIVGKLALI